LPQENFDRIYAVNCLHTPLSICTWRFYTISFSKDNEAARRRHPGIRRASIRRILHTLRKLMTQPTKLAKESELVLFLVRLFEIFVISDKLSIIRNWLEIFF
jgi:hypothetical protein